MAVVRKITPLGCPTLRMVARPVEDPLSMEVQDLIDDMVATLADAEGVGIAAPQVNVSMRLVIVAYRSNSRYPEAPEMEPIAMINPVITARSVDEEKGWEGCLSIPGIRGLVSRSIAVTVRYTDKNGFDIEQEFSGFTARVCQHELDHLDGLTYLDRLEGVRDIVSEECMEEPSAAAGTCLVEKGEVC